MPMNDIVINLLQIWQIMAATKHNFAVNFVDICCLDSIEKCINPIEVDMENTDEPTDNMVKI